jgi:hypothetical protein
MVNRRTADQRIDFLFSQVALQWCWVVGIDTDEMNDTEVCFVASAIEPRPRKLERWPIAFPETEDVRIEALRFLERRRSN